MAFGISKSAKRNHESSDFPDDWVGFLEPGVEVEGNMNVSGGLFRLNARFKGDIVSDGPVVVHEQGEVEGNIHSRAASIAGKVKGTVHTKDRLEIKEHGIVLGDIYTPCLLVDPGGFLNGQCHMPTSQPTSQPAEEVESKEHR
jgi:cytoskeletal protein CcmA (bactofilin family)